MSIFQCSQCLLDTNDDPKIKFNQKGICSYCTNYKEQESKLVFTGSEGTKRLTQIVDTIKASGKGRKYDSIIGLSGGVDSTYLALQAKRLGLRPLAVHFDNGWNSELAVKNIENIVTKLGFDLYTYVINWEEFKDLQLAYLKASVIDIEAITDHAIIASMYKLAAENNIKFILSGTNIVTEQILPNNWIFKKQDDINIKSIHAAYGTRKLKTFPFITSKKRFFYSKMLKIESVALLNLMPYKKSDVKKEIIAELDWRDYGGKHYESVWTRFYQGYILPAKFGVDKRKAHLSNLICSGQITKEQAINELKDPIYPAELLKQDMDFVLRKLGLSKAEFEEIMKLPVRSHYEFATILPLDKKYPILKPFKKIYNLLRS